MGLGIRPRKDYLKLLDETVKYYSEDTSRRALENGACKYLTEDGRMCAVGRCLDKDKVDYIDIENVAVDTVLTMYHQPFIPEYSGYWGKFWCELQTLHDNDIYWIGGKLSQSGKRKVERIKLFINEGDFDPIPHY